MNRRIESIKLCQSLQPLTQEGAITPTNAAMIVNNYVNGDMSALKGLITNPNIPVVFNDIIEQLNVFIQ